MEELGKAMGRIEQKEGKHPLFELETGRVSEADFLDKLARRAGAKRSVTVPRCTASPRSTSRR